MSARNSWLLQHRWYLLLTAWAWSILERTYLYWVTGTSFKSRWYSEEPRSSRCPGHWAVPLGETEEAAEIRVGREQEALLFLMCLNWRGKEDIASWKLDPGATSATMGTAVVALGMAKFQNSGLAIWETSLVFGSELIITLKLNV